MTDNKHDNDIAGFSRRDIYTVPDGFSRPRSNA